MSESVKFASEEQRAEVWQAIGKLCMVWASLDHALDDAIEQILDCSKAQARILSTQLDKITGRTKLIKQLLFTLDQEPEWIAKATELLNRIEIEVAPRRNRIIHDGWDFEGLTPQQIDKRAKIGKLQSRQPPAISFDTPSACSATEINDLIVTASVCTVGLLLISIEIREHRGRGRISPESSGLMLLDHAESRARELAKQGHGQTSPQPEA